MDELTLEEVASFLQWIWEQAGENGSQSDYVLENPIVLLSYADCYLEEKHRQGTAGELVRLLYQQMNRYQTQLAGEKESALSGRRWEQLQQELFYIKEEIKTSPLSGEKKKFILGILDKLKPGKKGDGISLRLLCECRNEFHGFLIGMGEASALVLEMLTPYPQVQFYLGV